MTAIFIDLDGTLTDPKPGITRSIQYALGKLDRPIPPEDELTWCIGPPLRGSLKKLLGYRRSGRPGGDALSGTVFRHRPVRERGLPRHRGHLVHACPVGPAHCLWRPARPTSMPSALSITSNCGAISNACSVPNWMARVPTRPTCWAMPCSPWMIDPSQAIMIGDRSFDMVGARNNGMTAVGVLYGYGSEAELRDAGAHHICATPQGLLDHHRLGRLTS